MKGLIGKKVGMTSLYTAGGANIACTVIELGPCVVTQVKTNDGEGYEAVQLGYGQRKAKNTTKPEKGHFAKAGLEASPEKVVEFRNFDLTKALGEQVKVEEIFAEGDKVSVIGQSKGKGFQGVVKRHGFSGVGMATHGQHNRARHPGSIGACSFPARVFKNKRMAGRMGNDRVTVKNLQVVKIFPDKNVLVIKGAVPGHNGAFVIVNK